MAYLVGLYTLYNGTNLLQYGIRQRGMLGESKENRISPEMGNIMRRVTHKRNLEFFAESNPFVQEMMHNMQSKTFEQVEQERIKRQYAESLDFNNNSLYDITTARNGPGMAKMNSETFKSLNNMKKFTSKNKLSNNFLKSLDL